MAAKKRKDGLIEKTLTLNGERIHVYGHTLAEVSAKMEKLRQAAYEGTLGISKQTTFESYAEHWLETHTSSLSMNTQLSYERATKHAIERIGKKRMCTIKRSEIEKALNDFSDKPTMRNKVLSMIRMIYDMAIDDGIVASNPASNIKSLPKKHKERHKFTEKETNAILNAEMDDTNRLMVDILYYTGIRKGEMLGLSRKSIDKGVIHVREQAILKRDGKLIISPILKTSHAYRDIPIPSFLEEEIRAYMKANPNIYIFGILQTKKNFNTRWHNIMKAVSLYAYPDTHKKMVHRSSVKDFPIHLTPHEFRHNYCSMLYDKGVDVQVARKLMGHSSINTTLAIYTHLSDEKMDSDMDIVRNLFEKKEERKQKEG